MNFYFVSISLSNYVWLMATVLNNVGVDRKENQMCKLIIHTSGENRGDRAREGTWKTSYSERQDGNGVKTELKNSREESLKKSSQ